MHTQCCQELSQCCPGVVPEASTGVQRQWELSGDIESHQELTKDDQSFPESNGEECVLIIPMDWPSIRLTDRPMGTPSYKDARTQQVNAQQTDQEVRNWQAWISFQSAHFQQSRELSS